MTVGALLRAEGLSASYDGRPIFSGASLSLGPGLYALRGANGSGKSTLLRLLAGAQLPDGGERARFCLGRPVVKSLEIVSVPGYNIQGLQVVARYVLTVPQPSPWLFGGTAEALNIHPPHRNAHGAVEYPPAEAVFILERGTDKVLDVEGR